MFGQDINLLFYNFKLASLCLLDNGHFGYVTFDSICLIDCEYFVIQVFTCSDDFLLVYSAYCARVHE